MTVPIWFPSRAQEKTKAGDILGDSEKTQTDKKRQRRKMKTVKRVKIREKERRQKLRDASTPQNDHRKLTKSQAAERLQKVTKGGKATVLKVGLVLVLRSVCWFCYMVLVHGSVTRFPVMVLLDGSC